MCFQDIGQMSLLWQAKPWQRMIQVKTLNCFSYHLVMQKCHIIVSFLSLVRITFDAIPPALTKCLDSCNKKNIVVGFTATHVSQVAPLLLTLKSLHMSDLSLVQRCGNNSHQEHPHFLHHSSAEVLDRHQHSFRSRASCLNVHPADTLLNLNISWMMWCAQL